MSATTEGVSQPTAKPIDYALLLLLAALWGSTYTLIRIAVETIPPTTLIAARTVIAALLLHAIMRAKGIRMPTDRALWGKFAFQALFNAALPFIMIAYAEKTVTAGLATILNSTAPIFTFLINWAIVRREPASLRKLGGVVAGMSGVTLIVGWEALSGMGQGTLAQVALVVSAIFYAWAAIFGRTFAGLHPLVPAQGSLIAGAIWLTPLALAVDQPWTLHPSTEALVCTLIMGIFTTGFGFILYFRLLQSMGAVAVTSQGYLRVPVGVLIGVFWLGEALPSTAWIGLICVVVGVAAMTIPEKPRATQALRDPAIREDTSGKTAPRGKP